MGWLERQERERDRRFGFAVEELSTMKLRHMASKHPEIPAFRRLEADVVAGCAFCKRLDERLDALDQAWGSDGVLES